MAMTNAELESALIALTDRVKAAERLLANCVSVAQQNGVALLLQSDIALINTAISSLSARVGTLEENVASIV